MKTPGKESPNMLVQDAEYIVFPSPHRKRHQRTGRFYDIQTEHTKSRHHCAFSQIGCLAQKPHYSTTDQICCLHAYKTDRNEQLQAIQVNCKTFLSSADVRYPTCQCTEAVMGLPSCSVTTKHFNQNLPFQKTHRNRHMEVEFSKKIK